VARPISAVTLVHSYFAACTMAADSLYVISSHYVGGLAYSAIQATNHIIRAHIIELTPSRDRSAGPMLDVH